MLEPFLQIKSHPLSIMHIQTWLREAFHKMHILRHSLNHGRKEGSGRKNGYFKGILKVTIWIVSVKIFDNAANI